MDLTQQQIEQLDALTLTHGSHRPGSGTCWMEAIALVTGSDWTDLPPCTPSEVAMLGQRVNDGPWSSDEERTRELRARTPYLLRVEHGIEASRRRACQAAEIAREIAVDALRRRGLDVSAIVALPPITDRGSALAVRYALWAADAAAADYAAAAADYAAAAVAAADYAAAAARSAAEAAATAVAAADYAAVAARSAAQHRTHLRILDAWIGYPSEDGG